MTTPPELTAPALCASCNRQHPAPGRKTCSVCLNTARRTAAEKHAARKAQGLCTNCGRRAPRAGRVECQACVDKRKARPGYHKKWREKVKKRYWGRVAAGLCAKCGKTPPDPNRRECASCNARARARERARKKTRKAQGLCVDCGRPSAPGFATCAPCRENKRHYDAKRSGHAVYPATYTVYLRDSDDPLGRFETREDVALFLAFGRLDRDAVEVITDAPPILAYTGCN